MSSGIGWTEIRIRKSEFENKNSKHARHGARSRYHRPTRGKQGALCGSVLDYPSRDSTGISKAYEPATYGRIGIKYRMKYRFPFPNSRPPIRDCHPRREATLVPR